MSPLGITLPKSLSNPFGANGGIIDLVAAIVIILTALLLSRGMSEAAHIENILVILKVLAIVLFVIVGLTAIQASNYVPFIPEHKVTATGDFGGWQGIYAGVSMIFLAYIGFDSIAANSAEAINPQNDATWYFRFINHCDCFIRSCSFSISWYVPLFKICWEC